MHIAVIGLGLIGGSLVQALAAAGHQVLGYDADPAVRATARTAAARAPAAARWQVPGNLADTVVRAGTELVVLAVPLPAVEKVLAEVGASGYSGLVTDVTSVKEPVRRLATDQLHRDGQALAGYVGGHPMAGREQSGFAAGDPALFDGCAWVLCLDSETSLADWLALATLITGLGARVVPATATDHDRAVAAVSHVPHLVANAIAASAATDPLAASLAAGSFRDGTRVASSSPALVAAMCGGNATAAAATLEMVIADLQAAHAALDGPDPITGLALWLAPGHHARLAWPPRPGESRELPATASELLELGRRGGWVSAVDTAARTVTAVLPD